MRIAKLLALSALLLLATPGARADVATLPPVDVAVESATPVTLDGSTTIESYSSAAAGDKFWQPAMAGKITVTTCTWYRPCTQPPPEPESEPVISTTQSFQSPTSPAPEPASLALFGSGLLGVAAMVRRKLRALRS